MQDLDRVNIFDPAFFEFSSAFQRIATRLAEICWFRSCFNSTLYAVCLEQETKAVDSSELRSLALALLRIEYNKKPAHFVDADFRQWMKLLVTDVVELAFESLTGERPSTSQSTLDAPDAYLEIIVPAPNDPRPWVYKAIDIQHGLFKVSKTQKRILYALWRAKENGIRADLLCDTVWEGTKMDDLHSQKNNLHFHISKLRTQLQSHQLAIVRDNDSDFYVLKGSQPD